MESSFQPLVVLARRPVPNQNKGIEININKGEAQDKSGQIVKFIDKRNNNQFLPKDSHGYAAKLTLESYLREQL